MHQQNIKFPLHLFLQLSPEEEERRKVRRERNKQAAAKCRQRRVDHTNELIQVRIKSIKLLKYSLKYS